jgi:N-acetyl-anhydromuramyl-L-alanine amidase AmpD
VARTLLKRSVMRIRLALPGALAIGLSAIACSAPTEDDALVDEIDPSVVTDLDRVFAAAAAESGVPADLLAAIGHVETRWQMVSGEAEHEGMVTSVGLMGIRSTAVDRAAARAGVDPEELALDPETNIRAAALLLSDLAAEQGVGGTDLAAWTPVIAAWSAIDDADAVAQYVQGDVIATLATGVEERAESGELIAAIAPHPELAAIAGVAVPKAGTADYPSSIWRPSPNYNSRNGYRVSHVVIHTCEGNYAGCWGWLRNSAAGASAHYVVNASGSEITQLVREASRAWHVAASYACSRNGNTDCAKNGVSVNSFSVGIEHAGFASQTTWASGLIEASTKLTCDITRSHNIPRDRHHIVGHGQLQPNNRTDPGAHWPWTRYIDRVRAHCGAGGGGGTTPPPSPASIVIDSNNANNDTAKAKIELAGTWTSASATPGFYGSGYLFAATDEVSAPATFWFYLASAQTRTIDAWWTAGPNRATAATFVAYNAGGAEVGRSSKNQTAGGGAWQQLGSYAFTAGWNKVVLSRWATPGKVVIADAVRVR